MFETNSEDNSRLIQGAKRLLASWDLDYLKLQGFYRDSFTYSYVFQYPPPVILRPITREEIIKNYNPIKTKSMRTGLYVHIPYCTGSCIYCYFTRYPKNSNILPISDYLNLIRCEIQLAKSHLCLDDVVITSMAFGGGTPSILSGKAIQEFLSYINTTLSVTKDVEISFEASPETLDRDKLASMRRSGVNRISIGVQAFNNHLLKLLKRRHNVKMVIDAISAIKETGFQNLNIDLMYGLPKQSLSDWETTLEKSTELRPESISLYRLRIKPTSNELTAIGNYVPGEKLCMLMYVMAVQHFVRNGYIQASSHLFVTDKQYIQRHVTEKQGVEECNLIGLGVSSYSYFNKHFYWNEFSLEEYVHKIQTNTSPIRLGTYLSIEEQQRKAMVLGIHEYEGINRFAFKNRFGSFPDEVFGETISRLINYGLLKMNERHIYPSDIGYLFADEVCTEFYSDVVKNAIQLQSVHRYGINYIGREE